MLNKKDARMAIAGCNGITLRASLEEGLDNKQQKERNITHPVKVEEDDKRAMERVIAVDWALSKDKWQEEKAKVQDQDESGDVDMSGAEGSSESDDVSEIGNNDLDVFADDDVRDEEDSDSGHGSGDEEPVKPQLPPPEAGTTLFVRNVPFTATEDEFRILYVPFLSYHSRLNSCV
jgi:nucleolar protein 4